MNINPIKLKCESRYDGFDGWACRKIADKRILSFTAHSTKAEAEAEKRRLDRYRAKHGVELYGELELVRVRLKLEAVEGPAWRRRA